MTMDARIRIAREKTYSLSWLVNGRYSIMVRGSKPSNASKLILQWVYLIDDDIGCGVQFVLERPTNTLRLENGLVWIMVRWSLWALTYRQIHHELSIINGGWIMDMLSQALRYHQMHYALSFMDLRSYVINKYIVS